MNRAAAGGAHRQILSCVGPATGRLMLANCPPFSLFQVHTWVVYSSVVSHGFAPGVDLLSREGIESRALRSWFCLQRTNPRGPAREDEKDVADEDQPLRARSTSV